MDSFEDFKIEPNKGVGPFCIGMSEKELFKIIPANLTKRRIGNSYSVKTGSITLWVETANQKLTQVAVSQGFKGMLFGVVGIGCSVKEAEESLGALIVDDDFQLRVERLPGICFHTNPVINEFSPIPRPEMLIDGIYVFSEVNA